MLISSTQGGNRPGRSRPGRLPPVTFLALRQEPTALRERLHAGEAKLHHVERAGQFGMVL